MHLLCCNNFQVCWRECSTIPFYVAVSLQYFLPIMFMGKYFIKQPIHFPFLWFFLYQPHIPLPCTHESYVCLQQENIKHTSMKIKMWDELKNLHWDVTEYQDAAPEATLIRLSLLQKISVTYSWTELPKFKEYILSALSIFQSLLQIRKKERFLNYKC